MNDRVLVDVKDHVATVTLNRPEKNNAVDQPMFEGLIAAGEAIAADTSVRAVVLRGAGKNFCAGIDIAVFQGGGMDISDPGLMQPRDGSPANIFQSAAYVWRELPVPVIASLDGQVFGAGLQIALGADLRYASESAKLSVMEVRWGLIPDMAITTTLRHVVPVDRVKELTYTGRIVSGAAARELGLVTAVAEAPLEMAQQTATEIAGRSPHAVQAAKKMLNEAWHLEEDAALRLEATLQGTLMLSPNQVEAVMANMHKRTPDFSDPKR